MNLIVALYIAVGVAALFFGTITGDLLSLGIRSEIVSIVEKALTALVTAVGTVALTRNLALPPLPPPEEPPHI